MSDSDNPPRRYSFWEKVVLFFNNNVSYRFLGRINVCAFFIAFSSAAFLATTNIVNYKNGFNNLRLGLFTALFHFFACISAWCENWLQLKVPGSILARIGMLAVLVTNIVAVCIVVCVDNVDTVNYIFLALSAVHGFGVGFYELPAKKLVLHQYEPGVMERYIGFYQACKSFGMAVGFLSVGFSFPNPYTTESGDLHVACIPLYVSFLLLVLCLVIFPFTDSGIFLTLGTDLTKEDLRQTFDGQLEVYSMGKKERRRAKLRTVQYLIPSSLASIVCMSAFFMYATQYLRHIDGTVDGFFPQAKTHRYTPNNYVAFYVVTRFLTCRDSSISSSTSSTWRFPSSSSTSKSSSSTAAICTSVCC